MIKLVYCIGKRPDMTDAAFFDYWENTHGALARRVPGLRRLVQSHTLARTRELRAPDFDGMAELWFDDWAALEAARRSPEWAAISADEANFIDSGRVALFITEEHELL
ncbi:MAG: EthD domain-containing protein [Blastocatellia bacterium]